METPTATATQFVVVREYLPMTSPEVVVDWLTPAGWSNDPAAAVVFAEAVACTLAEALQLHHNTHGASCLDLLFSAEALCDPDQAATDRLHAVLDMLGHLDD